MSNCYEAYLSLDKGQHDILVKPCNCDKDENPSNREWMEGIEREIGESVAYDVLRCDLSYDTKRSDEGKIISRIWGLDFHLSRLQKSFEHLSNHCSNKATKEMISYDVEQPLLESRSIANELVLQISRSQRDQFETFDEVECSESELIIMTKLTLLWIPNNVNEIKKSIHVRGFISTNGKIVNCNTRPSFIVASLALKPQLKGNNSKDDGNIFSSMIPSRKVLSNAKLSSWSTQRKVLDQLKPDSENSEILLVDRINDKRSVSIQTSEDRFNHDHVHNYIQNFEILEGATSNFFAIYHDNTIRTATEGIVLGYVRHLVLKFAPHCGLKVDLRPCLIEDALKGLWKEAFITSSSRLIWPIEKVVVPIIEENQDARRMDQLVGKDGQHDDSIEHPKGTSSTNESTKRYTWKEIWSCEHNLHHNKQAELKWELLLNQILRHGGY